MGIRDVLKKFAGIDRAKNGIEGKDKSVSPNVSEITELPSKKKATRKKKVAVIDTPEETIPVAKKPRAKKSPGKAGTKRAKKIPEKTEYQLLMEKEKAEATANRKEWVAILSVEIDVDNMSNGSFDIDWNDYFIAKLVRAGYKGTDHDMVDQWFSNVCRNVIQENYEQDMADPDNRPVDLRYRKKSQ